MDYSKMGLKAGLEVHQQLDTNTKLFCRCPAFLRQDKPNIMIFRKLHSVPGEEGEVDVAVEHEALLNKDFFYEGYKDTTCLFEYDEEPPQEIDHNALDEAIKIALILKCEIYPVSQIMRKTVIDGSNTSGFQRSVLIGHDGFVETSYGKVGIESIALEEDAARIVERDDEKSVFRLDRLGIPLVEITTKPELKTPEEIKETALKIGEILRACKVKRGIGTIRQDLNISIKGHDRVEIKGFQEPKIMIKTVEMEIERQQKDIKKIGEVRNAKKDGTTEFLRPIPGSARMYPETDLELLRISRDKVNGLKKELPKLKSDIEGELKGRGLSSELVGLVLKDNLEEFNILVQVCKDSNLVAKMVSLWRNELAKKSGKSLEEVKEILNERILEEILERVNFGDVRKGDVKDIMKDILDGKSLGEAIKIEKAGDDETEEEIRKIIKEKPGLSVNAYMGLVMQKFKGKIDAKRAMEILERVVEGD